MIMNETHFFFNNWKITLSFNFFQIPYWHESQDRARRKPILTPLFQFHPLHEHLDISLVITGESSYLIFYGYKIKAVKKY